MTAPDDQRARPSWFVRLLDDALKGGEELRTIHRVRAGAVLLGLLLVVMVVAPSLVTHVTRDDLKLAAGVVFVVVLGAGGMVCRGVGEHRGSSVWKSVGYFLGAAAYGASATVALINGLHTLLRAG